MAPLGAGLYKTHGHCLSFLNGHRGVIHRCPRLPPRSPATWMRWQDLQPATPEHKDCMCLRTMQSEGMLDTIREWYLLLHARDRHACLWAVICTGVSAHLLMLLENVTFCAHEMLLSR